MSSTGARRRRSPGTSGRIATRGADRQHMRVKTAERSHAGFRSSIVYALGSRVISQ